MKRLFFCILIGFFANSACIDTQGKDITAPLESYEPWSDDAVAAFENILIQEGGRVKPLHTFSRFTLMQFAGGGRQVKFATQDGKTHKLTPPEWLMDVLFRGETAKDLPFFLVDDSAAVVQIGVSPKSKRDRYSYNQLLPGRAKLAELSARYGEKQRKFNENKKINPRLELDEKMILKLGRNISSFEFLLGQFGFARKGELLVNESLLPDELKQLAAKLNMNEMIDKMPEMTVDQLFQTIRQPSGESEEEKLFAGAMRLFFFHASSGRGLNILPPKDAETEEWISIGDAMLTGLEKKSDRPWAKEQMQKIVSLVDASQKSESDFVEVLKQFSENQRSQAKSRGEGERSEKEVGLYRGNYFVTALIIFILAFVIMSIGWLTPGSKFGKAASVIASIVVLIGCGYLIYGITLRCIIRNRPPITNLYDTILFITAVAVLLGIVLEYFTRIGVGLLVGVVSGVLGMFLSIAYEAKESTDTMGKLLAVLDTNFWLATHVTIINIGYGAGMVAAFLAMVFLIGRFVSHLRGRTRESRDFFKTLSRMIYGVVCFCLFFSLVGTVLGGIWANYSWGRFWGWDPKENGALMICLWCLVILHGRMGGYIRDLGIAMNSIILGVIVTFSWWGVNNLETGLHSYGFTEGVQKALYQAWGVMAIPFLMGIFLFFASRKKSDRKTDTPNKSDNEISGEPEAV